MKQLDLFEQTLCLEKEIDKFRKEWEKTRRSLYARQADIIKKQNELSHEHEIIKMNLCKGKIVL